LKTPVNNISPVPSEVHAFILIRFLTPSFKSQDIIVADLITANLTFDAIMQNKRHFFFIGDAFMKMIRGFVFIPAT